MASPQRRTRSTRATRTTRTSAVRPALSGVAAAAAADAEELRGTKEGDLASEYKFVYSDIRHLLLVSLSLFVLLVVIGFFL